MASAQLSSAELADLLRWYGEVGVDLALDETPHDRLAEGAGDAARRAVAPQAPANRGTQAEMPRDDAGLPQGDPTPPARPPRQATPPGRPAGDALPASAALLSAEQAVLAAREQAGGAVTLEGLRQRLAAFSGCSLKATATQLVLGSGAPNARVMVVGDPPGADDDRQGQPFAGAAGRLLDRMLAAIGLDRSMVYLATLVPWRPPGNRAPTAQEMAVCLPFIRREIELVGPGMLVCLGGIAAQALLAIADPIMSARGRWYDYEYGAGGDAPRAVRALVMISPGNLLRQPGLKRLAWRDLRALKRALDSAG